MKKLLNDFISKIYPLFYKEHFGTLKILKDNKNIFSYLFEYNDSSVIFSIRNEIFNVHGTLNEYCLFPLFNSDNIPSKILKNQINSISKISISFEESFYHGNGEEKKFDFMDSSLLYYFNINGESIKNIVIRFSRNISKIYFSFSDNNYYETTIINDILLGNNELNLYEIFIESLKIKKEDLKTLNNMVLSSLGDEKDNIKKIDKFYSNKDIVSLIEILKM